MVFRFILFIFLVPQFSRASIWAEPSIAYKAGKLQESLGAKSSLNGASFGGKIGWGFGPRFSLGIDGNYSTLEKEYTLAPRVLYPATQHQIGLFVAADFRDFQASSSYFFIDQLKYSTRDEELRGNAVKLGLSIPVVSAVRANFDYIKHNFQEAVGSVAVLPSDASTFMLSLSYLLTKD